MNTANRILPVLLLLCAGAFPSAGNPTVIFSPEVWKFGTVIRGETIQTAVTVKNTGETDVTISLLPTCTCLTVAPAERSIKAGGQGTFLVSYDSSDDTGITRKDFIVRTSPPAVAPPYYTLTGVVRAERRAGAGDGILPASLNDGGAGSVRSAVTVAYYYTPGCRSCEQFLSTEIPRLSRVLGVSILVDRKDVLQPALYEELASFASSRGETVREIPALVAGKVLLQGDAAIRKGLEPALRTQLGSQPAPAPLPPRSPVAALFSERLAALPIALAGLIDGVNPCAFTTLIFLLASLALAGRGRREVLLIGALFTLAVFLTYLGIGYGLFAVLRAASAVSIVSLVLRWALVAVLAVFAGLSVYDYALIRQGRPTQILLQLPSALKRQIHSSIRTRVRTAALVGSSLVLGFLVSVFEFACTGQVYLPMLAYLVRIRGGLTALALLLLYNLCFIVPLLIVFGASYLGVSSGRITTWFQAHMGRVKLGLAGVFVALAVFTLVG